MARFLLLLLAFLSPVFGAIATENARQDYVGSGSVAAYAFTFPVQAATELRVFRQSDAAGTEAELVYNTDYTVALGSDGTGTVTLTAGNLTNAYKLSIQRGVPYTQTYSPGTAPTYNAAALGRGLDRLQTEVARLKTDVARSIKIPYLEAGGDTVTKLTTVGTARSGQGIIFDASGNAIVGGAVSSGVAASAYIQTLLDDTTAAAARATLVLDDALITADGTTTSRDLSARFAESIDVRDFGVVADGATDNTTVITAAIATGKKLVFAGGGTIVAGQLTFNQAGQSIEFRDRTTLKAKTNTNATFLQITAANVAMYGEGIIDGNKANQTLQTIALAITGNDARISGLRVNNSHSYGIYGLDCSRATVERCKIVDSGNIGILFATNAANMDQTSVIGCIVDRSTMTAATIVAGGIQIHGSVGSFASSNILVQGCKVFLPTNPTDAGCIGIELWGNCTIASVTGNLASGGAMGVSFNNVSDSSITGNTCYNSKLYGIELADSSDTTVNSNSVDGNSLCTRGIILDGSVTFGQRISVSGNSVRRCVNAGIYSTGGARDVAISGNAVNCPSGCSGINLVSTQRFTIAGNLLRGAAAGSAYGIFLDTSWKGNISGNLVTNFDLNWLNVFASSAVTITDLNISGNNSDAGAGFATAPSGGAVLGAGFSIRGNIQAGFIGQGGNLGSTSAKTSAYTCTAADYIIKADAVGGAFTVTLPTNVPYGTLFVIKRMNAGANAVTIGGTIDGVVSPTLAAQYDRMAVQFNGTNYDRID